MQHLSTRFPSAQPRWQVRLCFLLAIVAAIVFSEHLRAEPPLRAARLGYISGTVSFSPAGEPDWVQANVNRPLTSGDRLWVDRNSRAEIQIGGAAIRLGAGTSVILLNLDDRIAQVQLSQGTLKARVRGMASNQTLEVDTPNLALTVRAVGEYRVEADPDEDATTVLVQSGRAEAYGEGASYAIASGQGYRFYGAGLSDYDRVARGGDDDLDRWARERDRRLDNSRSARYVSPEVVGYEDLDASGVWRVDPAYGNVWTPRGMRAGWTPYHDGHWSWVDPWGWTWVDDAPWGYAVSHYGRWANIRGAWAWVPGPQRERAVYAPALVGFVGGRDLQVSLTVGAIAAAVGWFPLAPREVYRPSYPVSRDYFDRVNRSNAVIAPAAITNVYNTRNVTNNTTIINNTTNVTRVVYANQRVPGAVVAVPAQAFVQSQPVAKAAVPVSREAAAAPVANVAAVAPDRQSVHGGARDAGARPPDRQRPVVARTAPPPPPVAFTAQQPQLAAQPGTPIDAAQRTQLKPAAPAAPAPKVNVVSTAAAPAPTALPPAVPVAPRTPQERKADLAKGFDAARPNRAAMDAAKADSAKVDAAKVDAAKVDAAKAAAAKADAATADAAKAAAGKADAARADAGRAEAAKAEMGRAEAARGRDAAKADAARAEGAKAEAARIDAAKADSAKSEAAKAAAAKADAARADSARAEAAKADAAKADAAKADAGRAEAARADAAKAAAAKADAAKADAGRAEAARADAAKADAAKAEAAKADAGRAEAARADAAKAAAAKADAARADAGRAEAAKAEAARADAARAAAAKADAGRAEAARAEAARAAAANAEAARAAAAKAEVARAAAANAEAARAAAANAEAAKAAAARAAAAQAAKAAPPAPPAAPGAAPVAPAASPEPGSKAEEARRRRDEEDARKR